MSYKIIYKCDRCGKEGEDVKLFEIALGVKEYRYSSYSGGREFLSDQLNRESTWCEECCAETGIKFQTKPEAKPVPKPTLEDIIRGWIAEEVEARNS